MYYLKYRICINSVLICILYCDTLLSVCRREISARARDISCHIRSPVSHVFAKKEYIIQKGARAALAARSIRDAAS